ncbi:hypothetical protein [uncultured Phascolarctobacterium sp.]|uniref:hypothetical protein n=1 Tax=uncultured Phascolarctobacterium sp. TaxID=512296 RepID=UPI0025872442|nr:hypothetical protein [uncultured Phascolarctobacterium sp.]
MLELPEEPEQPTRAPAIAAPSAPMDAVCRNCLLETLFAMKSSPFGMLFRSYTEIDKRIAISGKSCNHPAQLGVSIA